MTVTEIGIRDVYDATLCLAGKVDAAITASTPALRVVDPPAETVADLAGTYCRMAGDLAAMVDAEAQRSAQAHAVISTALQELETALRTLIEVAL